MISWQKRRISHVNPDCSFRVYLAVSVSWNDPVDRLCVKQHPEHPVTLCVTASHGADVTCIGWLGFKGERTHMKLKGIVENADYEVAVILPLLLLFLLLPAPPPPSLLLLLLRTGAAKEGT
jgi:hypothetical protein